jgi:hypothetical protein
VLEFRKCLSGECAAPHKGIKKRARGGPVIMVVQRVRWNVETIFDCTFRGASSW